MRKTIDKKNAVLGWHFLNADGKIARYLGSKISGKKVEIGQHLHQDGKIIVCKNGLHSSEKMCDAVYYSQYLDTPNYICRVKSWGDVDFDNEYMFIKMAASDRQVIAMVKVREIAIETLLALKVGLSKHPRRYTTSSLLYFIRRPGICAEFEKRVLKAMGITRRTRNPKK